MPMKKKKEYLRNEKGQVVGSRMAVEEYEEPTNFRPGIRMPAKAKPSPTPSSEPTDEEIAKMSPFAAAAARAKRARQRRKRTVGEIRKAIQ